MRQIGIKSERGLFLPIFVQCCLTAYLAGVLDWNNTTLEMSVSATSRQHPEPMKGRVQQLNSQSTGSLAGELGHQTLFFPLTSSACVSLIISFSLSGYCLGNKTQTGTWCWQQMTDTPRSSATIYLLTVNTVVTAVF